MNRRGFLRTLVSSVALAAGASTGLLPRAKALASPLPPELEPPPYSIPAFINEWDQGLFRYDDMPDTVRYWAQRRDLHEKYWQDAFDRLEGRTWAIPDTVHMEACR